jgi:ubiquinone/menaquinone biosynthesis C-methylase UbiE
MEGSVDAERPAHTGERFEPSFSHGRIVEAEHLARYAWASRFAPGRRVLDAACGMAYGTAMLARAGASQAVGIDVDEGLIEEVRRVAPPNVSFDVGDVRQLPYADDEFDLIVCFETIEHVPDPERVLDELKRVLKPGGMLALSTPNRDVYAPGNPFHLRELTSNELESELTSRFRSVVIRRQHTWVASGIFDDETFESSDHELIEGVQVRKAFANEPGRETYTLALAGDGDIEADAAVVDLSADIDLREWGERLRVAESFIESRESDRILRETASLKALETEIGELRAQLVRRDAELALYVDLHDRLHRAEAALVDYRTSLDMANSWSWKLTAPLRSFMGWLRKYR